jgi:hypothetical protein
MGLAFQEDLIGTWAASGRSQIDTDQLPQLIEGLPAHFPAIDLKLVVTVDDDDDTVTPGAALWDVIDQLVIVDIKSQEMVRLRGRHLARMQKLVTGSRFAYPANLPGTSAGSLSRTLQARIPFHGGVGGITGFQKYIDPIQPIDRIRGKTITVNWGPAALSTGATITAATLYLSFPIVPMKELIQGADIRYYFEDQADRQQYILSSREAYYVAMAVANEDRSHADYAEFNILERNLLSLVAPWQLVHSWNLDVCFDQAQYEAVADPEFIPLLWQQRQSALMTVRFLRQITVRTTNTNADDSEWLFACIYPTQDLVHKLAQTQNTAYGGVKASKPMLSAKNIDSVGRARLAELQGLTAHKLYAARDRR